MRIRATASRATTGLMALVLLGQSSCPGASKSMANVSGRGILSLDQEAIQRDKKAVDAALAVPMHSSTVGFSEAPDDVETWRNLGFAPASPDSRHALVRGAALVESQAPTLVPTKLPEMPAIDGIAVISIYRQDAEEQYIYAMLRSTFLAFPTGIHINVLVGNADDAYLSNERLTAELGAAHAGQVHVWPAAAATAEFMAEHFERKRRGSWNYARALAAYGGSRGLLLLEDDVEWGPQAGAIAAELVAAKPLQVVSFYNYECFRPEGIKAGEMSTPAITTRRSEDLLTVGFTCTQAMYFPVELVSAVSRYIQLRMHQMPYDNLINLFFLHHELAANYAYPSLVQHVGRQTAIHTSPGFHQSRCFHGDQRW